MLCESIINSINSIGNLVSHPSNQSVFELQSDPASNSRHNELLSLQRSLEQYSGRNQTLSYFGFLGHFSSGKSATINSVMNAKIRSTGPNPTDTAITLIAHNDNADTLIGTHRRGEIAVGTQLLDDPRLLSTVLVDTPGSGDPTLVEELVRDFLPFCDTLVYVLSAAAPLDNSDLPTLKKASEDLGFIPIKLVCTRADEFRKDKSVILSEENFDSDAANQFLIDLSRRLKLSIPGLNVSPEEMLLLDNQSGHNVEILQNIIFENLGGGATSAQQLHTHKVNYYANAARAIRDFYIQHHCCPVKG